MLTFSASDPAGLEHRQPTAAYLLMMVRGLQEAHGLSVEEAAAYLAARPGAGDWTPEAITALDTLRT